MRFKQTLQTGRKNKKARDCSRALNPYASMNAKRRQLVVVIQMREGSARDMPGQIQMQNEQHAQSDIRLLV